jgi:hypothetical protein
MSSLSIGRGLVRAIIAIGSGRSDQKTGRRAGSGREEALRTTTDVDQGTVLHAEGVSRLKHGFESRRERQ